MGQQVRKVIRATLAVLALLALLVLMGQQVLKGIAGLLEEQESLRVADRHDGLGNATLRELIDEGDAAEYTDWNPDKDFAEARASLRARLEQAGHKAA